MYVDNAMNRKQKFPQFHDHFLHTHSIIIYTFTNLPITFNSPSVLCSGPSPFVRQRARTAVLVFILFFTRYFVLRYFYKRHPQQSMLKSNGSVIESGHTFPTTLLLVLWAIVLVALQQKQLMGNLNDLDPFLCDATIAEAMNVPPLLDLPNEEEARRDTFSPIDSPAKEYLETIENSVPPINPTSALLPGPSHTPPHLVKLLQVSPLSYLQSSTPSPAPGLPVSQDAGLIFKEPREEPGDQQATFDVSLHDEMDNRTTNFEYAQVNLESLNAAHSVVEQHGKETDEVTVAPYLPARSNLHGVGEFQPARQVDDIFPNDQQTASREKTDECSVNQPNPTYPCQVTGVVSNKTPVNDEYQNTQKALQNDETFIPQRIQAKDQSLGLQLPSTGASDDNFKLQLPLDKSLDRRKRWMIAVSQCLKLLSESVLEQVTLYVMREMPPDVILQLKAWATTLDQPDSIAKESFRNNEGRPSNGTNGSTIAQSILQEAQHSQLEHEIVSNLHDTKPQDLEEECNLETKSNIPENLYRGNNIHPAEHNSLKALISPLEYVKTTPGDKIKRDTGDIVHKQLGEHTEFNTEHRRDMRYPGESNSQDRLHTFANHDIPVTFPVAHETLSGERENWHVGTFHLQSQSMTGAEVPEPQSVLQLSQWTQTGTSMETSGYARTEKRSRELFERSCFLPNAKRIKSGSNGKTKPKGALSEAAKLIARRHQDLRLRNQREQSVQSEHLLATALPLAPCATPSRFCHLCTRTARQDEVLVCKNVARGACRKVICFRCAEDHRWDVETLRKDTSWTCTHCRNVSVKTTRAYITFINRSNHFVCFNGYSYKLQLNRSVLGRPNAIPINESTNIDVLTVGEQRAGPTAINDSTMICLDPFKPLPQERFERSNLFAAALINSLVVKGCS